MITIDFIIDLIDTAIEKDCIIYYNEGTSVHISYKDKPLYIYMNDDNIDVSNELSNYHIRALSYEEVSKIKDVFNKVNKYMQDYTEKYILTYFDDGNNS